MSDDESLLEPEYETERISVVEYELEVFTVVPPPLEYMSKLHSSRQEISGRQVWTGSLVLSHYLVDCHKHKPALLNGKRILELGCGTGILGMVISKVANVSCVILTDGDEKAVELLELNLINSTNSLDLRLVKAAKLLWGTDASAFTNWCRETFSTLWSDHVLFDCIVAGDVLYQTQLPAKFFNSVRSLLAPSGLVFLCHVPRASVSHDVVVEAARGNGFFVERVDTDGLSVDGCPAEDVSRAVIYRIRRLSHI